MADKLTVSVGPWPKGVDNRSPDYAVPADALRNAVDVDLTQDGHIRRRAGYSRVLSVVAPHSLWSCPAGAFFAAQGALYRLNDDNTATAVVSGVAGSHVTYAYVNGDVFLSDGVKTWKLLAGATASIWGLKTPVSPPLLSPIPGAMATGSFLGAVSYVTASGEESGLSPLAFISSASGGVRLSNFPSPVDADVTALRLYLSTPGGSVLYHVADASLTDYFYDVTTVSDTGKLADTARYAPPLPSNVICYYNGRLFMAAGSVLWFTEPFAFGKVKVSQNFIQFNSPITVLEAVDDGLWLVADKTYFLSGANPVDFKLSTVFEYGAISNTTVTLPNDEGISWQSTRGRIMATNGGKAKNVQEERLATASATSGAALFREEDGVKQIVTVLSNATTNSLTAADFMEAEIIRPR